MPPKKMTIILLILIILAVVVGFGIYAYHEKTGISREKAIEIASRDTSRFIGNKINADLVDGLWHIYSNSGEDYLYNIDSLTGKIVRKYKKEEIK